ncbi:hypothetical protein ACC684_28495 [Rhizobium ruizarguesonis]
MSSDVVFGSGNVFADLGLSDPEKRLAEAEERLRRKQSGKIEDDDR